MSRNIPIVSRIWIHPGAVVVNVKNAHTARITSAAIMPKSMGKIVDLECDAPYVQAVSNASGTKNIRHHRWGGELTF
jgi:hypothetical protein